MKYQNPCNVPTGGNMTYAALAPMSGKQRRMLGHLKRWAGSPLEWEAMCGRVLGKDWDGDWQTLSKASGSWLIYVLQRGLVETANADEDLSEALQ